MDMRSRVLRKLVIAGLESGGKGHVGSSMSLIEILRVLYDDFLTYDPQNPTWPERDRLILSNEPPPIKESISGVNLGKLWAILRRFINGTEALYGGADYRVSATG